MEIADVNRDNVRALRRLRVLVAARDRRFLRVAGFLLARDGFEVESAPRTRDLLQLVEGWPPDIVILDASESLAEGARWVAAFEALHPHVTVVVVSDDSASASTVNLQVFDKWTSFNRLVSALRAMHLRRPAAGPRTAS